MKIKKVESRRELKRFMKFPEKVYQGNKNWVPKLDVDIKHLLSEKNPFFSHAWMELYMAYEGKKPIGRAAAIIDYNYLKHQDDKTGFFGFFESFEDKKIPEKLLHRCERELKKKGMKRVVGPMNPSSNDECGVLLDGFDSPPKFMMPYTPRYYLDILEEAGYRKQHDLVALIMDVSKGPAQRLQRAVKRLKKKEPGMYSRPVKMGEFEKEIGYVKEIYNEAWSENWGFVPWTEAELTDIARQMKPLVMADLVQIGFFEEEPAGFLLALPDYNEVIKKIGRKLLPLGWLKFILLKRKIKGLRLMAMGIKNKFQNRGLGALMYNNSLESAVKRGFRECEFSWILEDNLNTIKIGKMMGGEIYKKYRIYGKGLT